MNISKLHSGTVKAGRFIPDDPLAWALAFCKHDGKRVSVTITRERKAGSHRQQGYYFGVIIPLLMDYGYDKDEAHEALKHEHLRVPVDSGYPPRTKSYAALSTVEREEYHEKCRMTLSRMGTYCPLPNEVVVDNERL
jgi:hypothetical protein